MQCMQCHQETHNPKFCNRSCAASYTGRTSPKRKRTRVCSVCSEPAPTGRTYHKECYAKKFLLDYSVLTLGDFKQNAGSRNSYHTTVRWHARNTAYKAGMLDACSVCGYTLQVDCCHIKPVSDFNDEDLVTTVNALSNLIGLCPNHHWELDHNYLLLPTGYEEH